MRINLHSLVTIIAIYFCNYLNAQESDTPATSSIYSIAEGYWIRDTVVINLKDIAFNQNSVILFEEPGDTNTDTGFVVIDRRMEEDDVIAVGKIVKTNKIKHLYLLNEYDSLGNVIKTPDPENAT